MPDLHVGVLGAGVAGLATAVALARDGHRVTLVERDAVHAGELGDAPAWSRRGVAHFLQPHAMIPRGRAELREHLPDVYDALLDAGAYEVDVARKLTGPREPDDELLRYVAVRRPVVEWALRRAVEGEARVTVVSGVEATDVEVRDGRVAGVGIGGDVVGCDLVVDALGRRSPTASWLGRRGVADAGFESSDCGVVYYSRYYRQRAGFELPDGPWLVTPRGDLGYLGYATFPGDAGTFAALFAVPSGVAEWRGFARTATFEAAVATVPALRSWVDPEGTDPITDVLPMAGLRNSFRSPDPATPVGLVRVGDAAAHTDPVLAHGMAFALLHAFELARCLARHADVGDACAAFVAAVTPALRERYDLATGLDDQRHRMWLGEPVDLARPDGAYELFSVAAAGAVALVDDAVLRVAVRRAGLLDGTAVLDRDVALQRRISELFLAMTAQPRPAPGPGRDEMVALVAATA